MTKEQIEALIEKIEQFPAQLETAVSGLTSEQLTTPYLEGEWTVAQNVHHLADAHLNGYVRVKLALTEDCPPLKPYDQDKWAVYPDANHVDLETSFQILRGLHQRWGLLFSALSDDEWTRTGNHLEDGIVTVADLLRIYVTHGEAHLDQIQRTLVASER